MKKYIAFAKYYFKQETVSKVSFLGPIISYLIHVFILSQLFTYIFDNKIIEGFSKQDLIWYVIIAEIFMYSFNYTYKIICNSVKNGDISYNLSKPYNFMLRIISEQLSTLVKTGIIFIIGMVLGVILAGSLSLTIYNFILICIVMFFGLILQLLLNVIVGLLSLWIGHDVSSIWWIVSKFMLLLVFTPLDFFPKTIQTVCKILPTTHITYTPAQLFVHFSYNNFFVSLMYETVSIFLLGVICYIIYTKGVKKLNVNGV